MSVIQVTKHLQKQSVGIIKRFLSFNTSCSTWLAETYPNAFGNIEQRYIDTEELIKNNNLSDMDVLELGGVDRPLLNKNNVKNFVGVDVDDQDGRAYTKYNTFYKQSVEVPFDGKFDLVYSITLLEHVRNNTSTFRNIFNALTPSGKTTHYFPSKNAIYALVSRLIGNNLQRKLIKFLWGEKSLSTIGYPAFFNKCSAKEVELLLESIGYSDIQIKCYYRANSYFAGFVPAFMLVSLYENICRYFNVRSLATGLLVTAKR